MQKNVLNTDLSGKVAVVTGAGGVLCSYFAKVLARAGAKVALLDLNYEAAAKVAQEITEEGGIAKAYACNVLDKEVCMKVAEEVKADLGPCDILLNGAGGNNPRATTDKEYFEVGDIEGDTKSFFDLDKSGVEFVFNLNFIGTLIPTQAFASQMVGREGCNILNISSMNAYTPLTKIPAYSGAKRLSRTLRSGWLFISRKSESVSMRSHPGSSPPNRMLHFSLIRMERQLPVPARSWQLLPWDALATVKRNFPVLSCSCSTMLQPASSLV